ncbi:MAG: hypothetical protein E7457_06930 [Ruminococcaceae bacterium]|nr:hypothetical protein [Oscillospiraceae bacterium]
MSKTKISGKTLSIQLGRDETQILLVNGAELIHGITVQTPAGAVEDGMIRNADAVREMLKAATKTPEFKNVRQTVFTLCTSQVITDVITAPDLPAAKLEKLLQANVDMYFPVDMHDYQLAWEVIGPKGGDNGLKEVNVQLWAMPTSMISRYYQVANAAGLSVAAIDYIGSSIANAVGASFSKSTRAVKTKKKLNLNAEISLGKKKAVEEAAAEEIQEVTGGVDTQLHLLLEKDILGMTFVQNGQVMLQRFIRCGSDPSYQFGELAMMLEYFENMDIGRGCSIEGIAAGALAEDSDVVQELADLLGIPVRRFSASYDLRWFLCMGAARTNKDFGTPSLNKPGTAKRQFQSELWQYGLMLAGGLAVVAVVMFLLSSRLNWNTELAVLQNEQNMLTMQNAQVSGYADNYYEYESMYKNYDADWDTVFNSLYTHNDNLVLVLEELEGMMPKTTSVTQMQIMANGLNISFASPDKEEAAYVIMKLREMGYADLMAVSNLAGGGSGAATSYGSGIQKEAAPTVGSSTSELDQEALFSMAMGLSEAQFQLLWDTYGKHPESTDASNTFAAVKGSVTKDQRDEALEALLNSNPFAINWFKELLLEDFQSSDESILYPHIVVDLIKMGILQNGLPDTFEESKALLDKLVAALTDDTKPQKLEATETLFCTHRDMELAYLYHVKLAAGMRGDAGELYFLDVDKIAADISSGGSKTGDAKLDEMINALFPHLEIPTEPTEPDPDDVYVDTIGASLKSYLAAYTQADAHVKELLDGYLTAGTTGNSKLDAALDSDVSGGKVDEELKALLRIFRSDENATTGNSTIDTLMRNFRINMQVERKALKDQMMNCYLAIGGEPVDPTDPTLPVDPTVPTVPTEPTQPTTPGIPSLNLGQLFVDYLTNGTTGDSVMDDLIEQYLTTGSTGDPEADKEIIDFIVNGNVELDYKKLANFYLQGIIDGKISPNDETLKIIIGVVVSGSGLNKDTLADAYIKMYEKVWDKIYEEGGEILPTVPSVNILKMGEYFVDFINDGTSGNDEADAMCERFLLTGTTGNSSADLVLLNYILKEEHDLDYNKLVDYYQDAFASGKISLSNLNNDFIKGIVSAILNGGINEDSLKEVFQQLYEKLFDEDVEWPTEPEATEPKDPTKPTEPPKDIEEYYGVFFNYFLANDTTTTLVGNTAFEEALGRKLSKEAYELIDEDCRNYIKNTLKDAEKANAITTYINGGGIDETLKRRMADYRAGKNYSQDEVIHTMLAYFLTYCDYPSNNVLEVRMTLMLTQLANDANKGASQKPQAQQDTRIHFTVLLNYNDNLRQEELNRKGLDYSDKIAPLEVAE